MEDGNDLALRHLDAAYNLGRWLLGNEQDAADAVHDAYLRAARSADTYAGGNARAWWLAIVRNCCLARLSTRVRDQDGAALIIDYGHLRSDAGDTFQAIARHSFADPLKNPGQADLTAHVDFQALVRAAEDLGARVHGPVTQGEFLKRLGIETRAVTLMAKTTPEISADISGALKRLTDSGRGGMGSMFKAVAITEPHLTSVAGMSDEQAAPGAATP